MPDQTGSGSAVSPKPFGPDDYIALAQGVGALLAVANPALAGGVAAVTGGIALIRDTIVPALQHLQAHQLSVIDQAILAANTAALRLEVGAPPAPDANPVVTDKVPPVS